MVMSDEPIPWMGEAACAEVGGDAFFPEKGDSAHSARTICKGCPVTTQCLEYAQVNSIKFGVYAGLTPKQRKRLRQRKEVG